MDDLVKAAQDAAELQFWRDRNYFRMNDMQPLAGRTLAEIVADVRQRAAERFDDFVPAQCKKEAP